MLATFTRDHCTSADIHNNDNYINAIDNNINGICVDHSNDVSSRVAVVLAIVSI
jgi:hypothetical protein